MIFSLATFPVERLDLNLAFLVLLTLGVGSRITVPIPQLRSHISVSDTLIFLTLILYGGEAAIILAAVEAFLSARRFCSQWISTFFNAGALAISTAGVVLMLWTYSLNSEEKLHGYPTHVGEFITALFLISVTQFLFNTFLAAGHDSLKGGASLWDTWKDKYVMAFPTYVIGAFGAGALVKLIDLSGFAVMFAAVPVIVFLFLAYRMYVRNIELSAEQAEKAREYAKEMRERTLALRDSEERFRRAFDHAPIGIAIVSPVGKWLKTNRAMSRILGYSPREFKEMSFHAIIFEEDLGKTMIKLNEVQSGIIEGCELEQRYIHKDGSTVWTSWSVSAAGNAGESGTNLIFQFQDITERKRAEEKLQHEATHDALTGLPNRAHFMRRLDLALKKARKNPKYRVSVLFIDLDRFKFVNDSLGHFIGDELLVAIAQRLNASMRPPDMVARLGGDEFVVLVEGRYYAEKITRIADRIQKKISTPFRLQGHEVYTSASIGILNVSDDHLSSQDVIRDADTAMYQAKRSGKARHETFDENMRNVVRETLQLETDLRRAIQNEELEVWYQPIFSLLDGRVHSLEALVRWNHSDLGFIPPDRFIPLAEEIGLMDSLGDLIMRTACNSMRPLRLSENISDFRLSINLSSRQFGDEKLIDRITAILEETRFPADRLKLEITETAFLEYHDRTIELLQKLRAIGIETDIDDFGTGYSNLGHLVRLPISTLKIDRSFVTMMGDNPANAEVIRAVIALARNLGLNVIAEGIETKEQCDTLRELGCDFGQGYYYSRPLDAEAVREFLTNRISGEYRIANNLDLPEFTTLQ